jgi:copper(I)-binding protein
MDGRKIDKLIAARTKAGSAKVRPASVNHALFCYFGFAAPVVQRRRRARSPLLTAGRNRAKSTAVAYVVISNGGEGSDKLIGAGSLVAASNAALVLKRGRVARMRDRRWRRHSGHSRIAFKPGGIT